MEEHITRFLAALESERGFSLNTVAAYRNDLVQFLTFLRGDRERSSWAELTPDELTSYVLHLRERQYADSTVARKVAAVRSFCHFLVDQGILRSDPSESLPAPKVDKFVPRAITAEEVERLFEQTARERTPDALRDRAMLQTLYWTGMRVSELTSLDLEDIDFAEGQLRCGKKPERTRWVPLPEEAMEALREYLELGRPLLYPAPGEEAVFLNHRGTRLTRQGFWLILKAYAEAADIPDITPHTLRHTFAAHALIRGHELKDVKERLGHMSISTTQVYQQVAAQVRAANRSLLVESIAMSYDRHNGRSK